LLNKDLIENDPEKAAIAIIEFKNSIIKHIHTHDSLIFDPWISAGEKEQNVTERGFVQMIKELAEFSTDYTCNGQNKEMESQSKK
jgi:hypothetical protein